MTSALLPFVGGAYRLFDRVVVGVAAYPTMGLGTTAKYRPAPDQFPEIEVANKASQGLLELGTAASVRVLDNLSVGLTWRVNYAVQKVSAPLAANNPVGVLLDPSSNPITADIDVSGFNFAGLQAGVFYKPLSNLRLGLTYRSKVVAVGTGTTTTKSPLSGETLVIDTRSAFTSPHTFRAGVALSVLEDKLLLAADFKYLMYAEAWKQIETTTTQNGVTSTTATPAYWKDSVAVLLGGEFKASELFRPRLGYALVTSATNPAYAQQLMAPPGLSHLVTGGLGIKVLDGLNVDLSAGYVVLQSRVETATPYNAGVGIYGSHAGEFSLSVTYHM